jgi:hypothetical protein
MIVVSSTADEIDEEGWSIVWMRKAGSIKSVKGMPTTEDGIEDPIFHGGTSKLSLLNWLSRLFVRAGIRRAEKKEQEFLRVER